MITYVIYKVGLYAFKKAAEYSITNSNKYFINDWKPCNINVTKLINYGCYAALILI